MAGLLSTGAAASVTTSRTAALEQSLKRSRPHRVWTLAVIAHAGAEKDGASSAWQLHTPPTAETPNRSSKASRPGSRARARSATAAAKAGLAEAPRGARIGVVSDNHGYLDPGVLKIFAGVDHIIHAGDVMDPAILEQLATVAPVTAVAGNMDSGRPTSDLPREVVGEVAGVRFLVGHKRKRLLRDLAAGAITGLSTGEAPDLVVYGHDHVPVAAWVEGTLYLDPGSASAPREEDDEPTVAIVEVRPTGLAVTFIPVARSSLRAAGDNQP